MPEDDVRMISVGRARIGMRGLGAIFDGLVAEGRAPSAEAGDETDRKLGRDLVKLASAENYVAPSAHEEYAKALLAEYHRYLGEDVPEAGGVHSIRILGPGCPRCERLAASVVTALERLGLAADVEHIRDAARIVKFGVVGTPALVVNGEVASAGRALSPDEVAAILSRTTPPA